MEFNPFRSKALDKEAAPMCRKPRTDRVCPCSKTTTITPTVGRAPLLQTKS